MPTRDDAWEAARRLVVGEGATYAEAAEATGIPLSTLQKRAAAENWQKEREHALSYAAQVKLLKQKALDKALASGDPQDMYAWQKIEAAWPEHRYTAKADPRLRLQVGAEVLQLVVDVLTELAPNALAEIEPHIPALGAAWEERCQRA